MPWLKVGDTAANHPTVLAVLEHEAIDDRLVNEVFGFVMRCALQSTAHLTDYVINRGTALAIGGFSRATVLLDVSIYAGYMTEEKRNLDDGQGIRTVYKLMEDPEFIHMRTKEEIEWERQRKLDNADPSIIIPVRLRDGDACRYCGLVVSWTARKGRIAGTYDHRIPGQRSRGPQDSVVACGACNAARGDDPKADLRIPLMPAPAKPYFTQSTVDWITNHDWAQRNGFKAPKPPAQTIRPGQPSGTGNGKTATSSNGTSGSPIQGDGTTGPTAAPALPAAVPSDGSSTPGSPIRATAPPAHPASNGAPGSNNQGNGTPGPPQAAPAAAPDGRPPAPGKPPPGREGATPDVAPHTHLQIPADPAGRESAGSGNSGSGRDGSGRVGTGAQLRDQRKKPPRRTRPRKRA